MERPGNFQVHVLWQSVFCPRLTIGPSIQCWIAASTIISVLFRYQEKYSYETAIYSSTRDTDVLYQLQDTNHNIYENTES